MTTTTTTTTTFTAENIYWELDGIHDVHAIASIKAGAKVTTIATIVVHNDFDVSVLYVKDNGYTEYKKFDEFHDARVFIDENVNRLYRNAKNAKHI